MTALILNEKSKGFLQVLTDLKERTESFVYKDNS